MTLTLNPSPVRRLACADLGAMLVLQQTVAAGLPEGYLWPKTADDLRGYLDEARGAAFGILEGSTLVAMALLRIPDRERPNGHPRFRPVPEADWDRRACFLENAMVLPRARGRGYQRALVDVRLSHAAARGMRWVCGGVRLHNQASWANLLAKGLAIADMRFDLGEPMIGMLGSLAGPALASDPASRRSVPAHDAAGHRDALRDGYVGVGLAPDRSVIYERLYAARG